MSEALILERDSPLLVTETGRILARHLGLHAADATARVRYSGGILVEDGTAERLRAIQSDLRTIGVETRIVPAGPLRLVPHGYRAIGFEFLEEALLARMVGGSSLVLLREEIRAVHFYGLLAARQASEQRDPSAAPGNHRRKPKSARASAAVSRDRMEGIFGKALSPRGRALLAKLKAANLAEVEWHLTLCCPDPVGPVRITKDLFDFSCLERQKQIHSLDNFLLILDDLTGYLPDVWNRQPLTGFLRDLDPEKVVREKREEVTRFERWLYQWIRLDQERSDESAAAAGREGDS